MAKPTKPSKPVNGGSTILWIKDSTGLQLPVDATALEAYRFPVHLGRQVEKEMLPSQLEALGFIQTKIMPLVDKVNSILNLSWIEHVYEESTGIEHLVIPEPFFRTEPLKRLFLQAGFSEQVDMREFASTAGLRDALLGGANFNKKWH